MYLGDISSGWAEQVCYNAWQLSVWPGSSVPFLLGMRKNSENLADRHFQG